MSTLLIAIAAGVAFIVAYHTYGRWLGSKVFNLAADTVCPSERLRDDQDYVPTSRGIVFGHHFTSIAGTGPIVGPAIAVMWGWLPALLWVVLGSIFIGAVHDFGSLVVSLRNDGQTVGEIAGRVLNKRVRLLFLFVLFMALTIVLAIFGLVIAAVFKQYPAAIFPCMIQIPIAVTIGVWLHRKGVHLLLPSVLALGVMYGTVVMGDQGILHSINEYLASLSIVTWVIILLVYSYAASVLPVWSLLQPRDYINSLQLLTALGLVCIGLIAAAFIGGAPPVEGAERQPLEIVAPMVNWSPEGAPMIFPFLFITIACGAISGFHCLVSSGTSSKQLKSESDAQFVGYGSMLTEGFLATIVILACVAGLGLGSTLNFSRHPGPIRTVWMGQGVDANGREFILSQGGVAQYVGVPETVVASSIDGLRLNRIYDQHDTSEWGVNYDNIPLSLTGRAAYNTRYSSWQAAGGLAKTVGAFVDGSANLLKAIGIPGSVAVALMGVLVASFAGTTLDTACRLQRYVVQELAGTFLRKAPHAHAGPRRCVECDYDLRGNQSGDCPECGAVSPYKAADGVGGLGGGDEGGDETADDIGGVVEGGGAPMASAALYGNVWNPLVWLSNKHGATIFAIVIAAAMAAMPAPGAAWSWASAGKGGLILWPMFGATNQLLGGLAFLVIAFWLRRRGKPVWFVVLPLIFMLIMPAWAMGVQVPEWWAADDKNWALILIAVATVVLEVWMVVEAVLLWPKVKGDRLGDGHLT